MKRFTRRIEKDVSMHCDSRVAVLIANSCQLARNWKVLAGLLVDNCWCCCRSENNQRKSSPSSPRLEQTLIGNCKKNEKEWPDEWKKSIHKHTFRAYTAPCHQWLLMYGSYSKIVNGRDSWDDDIRDHGSFWPLAQFPQLPLLWVSAEYCNKLGSGIVCGKATRALLHKRSVSWPF